MAITPVNKPKNSITPSANNKSGYALWDDTVVTWDDPVLFWDSPLNTFVTNKPKNNISPVNKVKN